MEIKGGEVRKLSACHCMAQGFCAVTRIVELGSPSQDEDSAKAAQDAGAAALHVAIGIDRLFTAVRGRTHQRSSQSRV
jgi:hypothetical protein